MSDALIGVIVGGFIASLVPLGIAYLSEKRWRLKLKLKHLKAERARLEKSFGDNLQSFGEAMTNNSYPSNMISDITILMPRSVADKFLAIMDEGDKTEERMRHCYLELAIEMKSELSKIDLQIEALVSKEA